MKLTKYKVKWFEKEQKEYGTEIALYNLIWQIAAELFEDLEINKISTK